MREVPFRQVPLAPYEQVLGERRTARLRVELGRTGRLLGDGAVWNVNSTAAGGGVAELLHTLGPLARAAGLNTRWLVVDGDPEFYTVAKRLVSMLYGIAGDGGALGAEERRHYRRAMDSNAEALAEYVRPGDVVIVHEAQPAGLIEAARALGASVVWRSHIGSDTPNRFTREGGAFVSPYVAQADATVFSTPAHVTGWAPRPQIIAPSIDPCGPKNMALSAGQVAAVLGATGILAGGHRPLTVPVPIGPDVEVRRPAQVLRDGPPPPADVPMVVQVSRWDRLKDMGGVMRAFVDSGVDGYLTLAGADLSGVTDDPEAAEVYERCRRAWEDLPPEHRRRCQLVCLPMADLRENAVVVNALQRHASVVVQKSLAEGFGLTATEAMWKARPLLAAAAGGLRDQVRDGETGLLLGDPADLAAAATGIRMLSTDRALAGRLGAAARRRVHDQYLPDRQLLDWARLIESLAGVRAA
ncbi:glycosyltransferase [Sphaerisporangium sp. TRM90804]|uniref:glycosyltransferase n=1 Tax=Sphaerisporangium sp. TRM90804 TaxID=3031113 RepID=UPI00244C7310|nr:glycosyltransferase [Sphaerisporangium sp. TRM90804]MDH2426547.1 glycosyltransferase [Sphaerisporangium sp. TRM90804]